MQGGDGTCVYRVLFFFFFFGGGGGKVLTRVFFGYQSDLGFGEIEGIFSDFGWEWYSAES